MDPKSEISNFAYHLGTLQGALSLVLSSPDTIKEFELRDVKVSDLMNLEVACKIVAGGFYKLSSRKPEGEKA